MLKTDRDKYFKAPTWSMGDAGREEAKAFTFPGPGSYKPGVDPRYPVSAKYSMSGRTQALKKPAQPGPGQYETRGGMEGRQSSLSGRPEKSKRGGTPGPGSYKVPSMELMYKSGPKMSFGSSSRSDLIASKTPGPGQYETVSTLGGNCCMKSCGKYSLKGRASAPTIDITPGPPMAGTVFK